jgi:hypothetical protein
LSIDYEKKWKYMENAHILGARYPVEHTKVHTAMFIVAIQSFDIQEIFGQIPRLATGWIVSLFNIYPRGNSGRSDVPILSTATIPDDLQKILAGK